MSIFMWIGPRDLRLASEWAERRHGWAAEVHRADTGRPWLRLSDREDPRITIGLVIREAAGFAALDAEGQRVAAGGKLLDVLESLAMARADGAIRAALAAQPRKPNQLRPI
ncbi:MAG: hypothetical protein K2X11_01685 [Acetobacteraceae bacterium]|nr:hypothetical protein [Acetobacteraceae bacterium]